MPIEKLSEEDVKSLAHVIIYRTPYGDEDVVVAAFTTRANAERVVAEWRKDLHDDEDLVLDVVTQP